MMKKRPHLIGIDIGSFTLKVVGLRTGKYPAVSFYSIVRIPEGCDEKTIAESIQKVLREKNVSVRDTVLTFTGEPTIIRRMALPHVARNEVVDALKWQMKDIIAYDVERAALDFELLGEAQKEDGSKIMDLLVVAASRDGIDKNVRILKEASLNAISITASPFALKNILRIDRDIDSSKAIAVVDIGYKKTEVSIFRNKALEFVRYVPVGSGDITDAMTGSSTLSNGGEGLSKDEAEKLKIRLGISYDEEPAGEEGIASRQIVSLERPVLERLSKEIKRSMDYYTKEYGVEGISRVYLVGGGALLKNLDRFLSEELNAQVKLMKPPGSIDISRARLLDEDAPSILSSIGAALGYKDCPNLLPREYRIEKIEFIEKISLRVTAIIVGVILLASFSFIKFRVDDYSNRLKNATLQKNILNQIKDLQDRVVERSTFLAQARMSEISLEYIMKEMSNIVPSDVVLDSLVVNQKSKTLDMKGIVYEPRGLAEDILTKVMEAIERSKYFRDAQLASVQGTATGREPSSSFEMSCSLE